MVYKIFYIVYYMNGITKYIKYFNHFLSPTHYTTSLGVRMRNPFDKNGMWIGWTNEEVAEHFSAVNNYKQTLPKEKEPNGRGC